MKAPLPITLRPARPEDEEFLFQVYASTREEELSKVPWSREQKESFLRMQFLAQDRHYRAAYPEAQFQIILEDEHSAGRLFVSRQVAEIHLVDVALLPAYRGRGIGKQIMEAIAQHPDLHGLRRWHLVTRDAHALYAQFGFEPIDAPERHMMKVMRNAYDS